MSRQSMFTFIDARHQVGVTMLIRTAGVGFLVIGGLCLDQSLLDLLFDQFLQ